MNVESEVAGPQPPRTAGADRATHRVAARALLTDPRGRILIVRRAAPAPPWWHLPGGKVEVGESPRAACHRELLEELGVDIPVGDALASSWNRHPREGTHDWLTYLFGCGAHDAGVLDTRIVPGPGEIGDWRWAPREHAMTLLDRGHARLLHAALTRTAPQRPGT